MLGFTRRRALFAALAMAAAVAARADSEKGRENRFHPSFYQQTNLISDIAGVALNTDPNLVNPWGLAINPNGPIWIADNATGLSAVVDGGGNPLPSEASPLVVTIPPAPGSPAGTVSAPTGTVFNGGSAFVLTGAGPARFLFATEDGTVAAWSPAANPKVALLVYDNSASGAIYKGLAIGASPAGPHIYLTNFHAGTVDVLDGSFMPVTLPGGFVDPNLPSGYAPFGIQNVGGMLFVSYAKQDADAHDDDAGPGRGFIDVFTTDGALVRRFASGGALNSPWGMAVAPARFGPLGGSLLVGNFGNGRINAYNLATGSPRGPLTDFRGRAITIDGLWGLAFSPVRLSMHRSDEGVLYFTAGIAHESHGLFGRIDLAR